MHGILIKLVTLAAMLHMGLGCAWHHGIGNSHACPGNHRTSTCHNHEVNEKPHIPHIHGTCSDQISESLQVDSCGLLICISDCGREQNHSGCQDDRCLFTKLCKLDVGQFDMGQEFLVEVMPAMPLPVSRIEKSQQHHSICPYNAPGLRAHIALGVQII